jgi:asparagine synthase (glutamine-hydrolysing)
MCRHAGIVPIRKEPVADLVLKMAEHQIKGGPDHTGFYSDDNITMSHNRLSIIDPSANGNQPMQTDRWVLSFVGEIYNYQDLKTKISPRAWKSYNDTETLLFYIDQFSIDKALQDAEGMFSIALYDKIYKKLYLAVDQYSIKQMFWYKSDRFFVYGSSPAPITFIKDKWEIDKFALLDMLTLGATRTPLFEGIKRVAGGQMVVYDVEKETVLTTTWYERKEHKCNENDLIEAVKHSIQITKMSDVPSFIFLSGGIDSTIVASQCEYMNAVHLKSPEEEFAKEAANKYHNTLHFVEPRNYSAKECLEDYARQSGDCSMAALQPYIVSKEVCKFGKVAISANGADELCYGYHRMLEEPNILQWSHIFRTGLKHSWGDYADYKTTRELELNTYVQYDLNKTLDFASMCHSLEVRVPYLNKTVVEMALSIPRAQHVNGYGNKSILKKFLKSEGFGNEFLTRPKLGFSLHSEPSDYAHLKVEGLKLLRNEFDIKTHFHNARDARYFEASAAAFLCWMNVWRSKLS